jgi:hypothetical protein
MDGSIDRSIDRSDREYSRRRRRLEGLALLAAVLAHGRPRACCCRCCFVWSGALVVLWWWNPPPSLKSTALENDDEEEEARCPCRRSKIERPRQHPPPVDWCMVVGVLVEGERERERYELGFVCSKRGQKKRDPLAGFGVSRRSSRTDQQRALLTRTTDDGSLISSSSCLVCADLAAVGSARGIPSQRPIQGEACGGTRGGLQLQ